MNIAPGETVTEIEVIEIKLTQPQFNEAVLRQFDREIPYHNLFILSFDGKVQAWTGHKEAAESGSKAFKVNKYYHTDWMQPDELNLKIERLNSKEYTSSKRNWGEADGDKNEYSRLVKNPLKYFIACRMVN